MKSIITDVMLLFTVGLFIIAVWMIADIGMWSIPAGIGLFFICVIGLATGGAVVYRLLNGEWPDNEERN